MKLHQFAAMVVLLLAAAWVLTGDFSFVGSASTEDGKPNTVVERQEEQAKTEDRALQAVGVAKVPSIQHARSIRISGITQADKSSEISARTSAAIDELKVSQGDVVKKDQVILKLASEGREEALASAQQSLEQAQIDAEAKRKLVERGTLPKVQLDQAMSALRSAESGLERAKVEMSLLEVKAPFAGVVDNLKVEAGTSVQAGTPVATLVALDPIIGIGEVNESDLPIVKVGNEASLRLVTGEVVSGKIRYISRVAQATTRTYTVEVEAPNADMNIPVGMTSEVILKGEAVSAKPVPRSVVTLNVDGELGVTAVDENDVVLFYPIDIVDDSTGGLILGGIPEDARIIVQGQNLVSEGQKVQAIEADQEQIDKLIEETRSQIEGQ